MTTFPRSDSSNCPIYADKQRLRKRKRFSRGHSEDEFCRAAEGISSAIRLNRMVVEYDATTYSSIGLRMDAVDGTCLQRVQSQLHVAQLSAPKCR